MEEHSQDQDEELGAEEDAQGEDKMAVGGELFYLHLNPSWIYE